MKKMKLAAVVLAVCVCATFFTRSHAADKQREATLQNVSGTVMVMVKGTTEEVPATDKMKIKEGDRITTRAKSSVILKFEDGSMVKIGPMSVLKLDKSTSSGVAQQTELNVGSGKIWTRVNKLGSASSFNVRTPAAIAGVRGTYYSSEVDQDSASRFNVFDGSVAVSSVSNPDQVVLLKKNQTTTVAAGKAPEPPKEIPKEEVQKEEKGFTESEYTAASYEVQVNVNPPEIIPGQKAVVTIQVFKNGEPAQEKATLKVKLGGSAKFVANNTNQIQVDTDSNGVAVLEVTGESAETVTIDVKMMARVKKAK